jgi:hypothetical protein
MMFWGYKWTKKEQQLLEELYRASLEENKALRKIADIRLAENKKQALEFNEFERRDQVDALMQEILIKNKLDYFHAAMIYSHGETLADYKKTNRYAEQALNLNDEIMFSEETNRQLRAVYERSYDKWQVAEGKKPKYSSKNSSDPREEDERRLTAGKTPMLKPPLMQTLDLEKKNKEKKKKEEEERKSSQVACDNCGDNGHSSASCLKPKKKG